VVVDRPLGSRHPSLGFGYPLNYGELPAVTAADGDGLDAYVIGPGRPVARARGLVVAVLERAGDDDPKLIVSTAGAALGDAEIERAVAFQEGGREHRLHRAAGVTSAS
jgi:inorganic pyrophosphatase